MKKTQSIRYWYMSLKVCFLYVLEFKQQNKNTKYYKTVRECVMEKIKFISTKYSNSAFKGPAKFTEIGNSIM